MYPSDLIKSVSEAIHCMLKKVMTEFMIEIMHIVVLFSFSFGKKVTLFCLTFQKIGDDKTEIVFFLFTEACKLLI